MKAIIQRAYGPPDVLELREVERPTPKDNEVLLSVHASSVNRADWIMLTGTPFLVRFMSGLFKPSKPIAGLDVAGRVEAVGTAVKHLHVGDEVYGEISQAWAEYVCVDEAKLALKPKNLSWVEAAAAPLAGVTAMQAMANVQRGQRVLINGASGGVGSYAVQMARAVGAEVTAVCSARNAQLMRSLGATHVIDYAREDFSAAVAHYDVIFDLVGSASISRCRKALKASGLYLSSVGATAWLFKTLVASLLPGPRVKLFSAQSSPEALTQLAKFFERGEVKTVIDRTYALSEVPDALAYQGTGRTRGKCVITIA